MITASLPLSADEVADAVEGLVRVNVKQMAAGDFPPLYASGIRYKVELGEDWQSAKRLLKSKRGDCEDLAAYRAAELRVTGRDPEAHVVTYRSRPGVIHAIVERGDGSREDPSIRLGMKPPKSSAASRTHTRKPRSSSGELGWTRPLRARPPREKKDMGWPDLIAPWATGTLGQSAWSRMFQPSTAVTPPAAQQPMYYFPGQPMMMPVATQQTLPGGINPWLALLQLQSGQQLGLQAQLAQLASGQYQATLKAPGLPPVQATASTPQAAGKGTMGALAAMASNPALQAGMGPYGPAIAAGAQAAAILANDKQVQKAMKNAGKGVQKAFKSIGRSKPVKALAKLFGIK